MANYAEIINGIVVNVVVATEEWVDAQTDRLFVQYHDHNPASIGCPYEDGFFYFPQPYPSWTKQQGSWVPPTPMPTDAPLGQAWVWNEANTAWVLVQITEPVFDDGDDFLD
jgi:hypothetical protein